MHVAAYVEQLGRTHSKPTVKQHLAAIRMPFDWLVTGHVVMSNPAHAVRGPKHSVRKGKTSVLSAEEMHELLAAIDTTSLLGLREKGGKVTELPCRHNLDQYLEEWIAVSGIGSEPDTALPYPAPWPVVAGAPGPAAGQCACHDPTARPRGRARTKVSAHSFRATGITTYLQNGGKLEIAQKMAGHESARTTDLYDRRNDDVALDKIERITY